MTESNFVKSQSDDFLLERRQPPRARRELGRVVACDGSSVEVATRVLSGNVELAQAWSVGRMISIVVGEHRIVALVSSMDNPKGLWHEREDNVMRIQAELMGQVTTAPDGTTSFSTGISHFPHLGALVHDIRAADLELIYDSGVDDAVTIGALSQAQDMKAAICMKSMLSRHFAVVGSTGVGKSTAVSVLINKAIASDENLRVIILDPHDEFANAFPAHSVAIDAKTLDLPFWLFKLEEFAEVIFRGQNKVLDEINILRELVAAAKRQYKQSTEAKTLSRKSDQSGITADTPIPYRISDLQALLDERIGRLDGRDEKPILKQLKSRIEVIVDDPRFAFMFSEKSLYDSVSEVISTIFRIPGDGAPLTVLQMSGLPSEVVDSVVSVISRMAFDIALWGQGAVRLLLVCEEAHRYVSSNRNLGFEPTRQSISRIAKEGRKYGIGLGIVSQRPGELDPTILSQCSTVFAMRLANDRDQDIIRSALPNTSQSTVRFLASIGNGEAIAFGEAVSVPMRMKFERVPERKLPRVGVDNRMSGGHASLNLSSIISKMRHVDVRERKDALSDIESEFDMLADMDVDIFAPKDAHSSPYNITPPATDTRHHVTATADKAKISHRASHDVKAPTHSVSQDQKDAASLRDEMNALRAKLLGRSS